ncbi:hypothetical protein V6C32_08775 [Desulforamulus ruminis]|uniref:Uncharacterized protein n=1 Tax=Desulforamulus ruminis (strain ATCC 23193 / DSM 2154 / NCIMB 8452 / DL) TaxID=696281 RepID=F6DKX7_DESRL|nr:hypothetical protein [Desulforamulus ruminis]AEG61609.1 hypothetical protein Desru_3405 [Desulforamulus ruminis DSM 2154]
MDSMLNFYSQLSRTDLIFMFLAVTAALAATIIGFNRRYRE